MTETIDVVSDFGRALPPNIRSQLHRTERLVSLVYRAVHTTGWTVEQLVHECTRDHNGANAAAAESGGN